MNWIVRGKKTKHIYATFDLRSCAERWVSERLEPHIFEIVGAAV